MAGRIAGPTVVETLPANEVAPDAAAAEATLAPGPDATTRAVATPEVNREAPPVSRAAAATGATEGAGPTLDEGAEGRAAAEAAEEFGEILRPALLAAAAAAPVPVPLEIAILALFADAATPANSAGANDSMPGNIWELGNIVELGYGMAHTLTTITIPPPPAPPAPELFPFREPPPPPPPAP